MELRAVPTGISRGMFSSQGEQKIFKGFQGMIQASIKFKGDSRGIQGFSRVQGLGGHHV